MRFKIHYLLYIWNEYDNMDHSEADENKWKIEFLFWGKFFYKPPQFTSSLAACVKTTNFSCPPLSK